MFLDFPQSPGVSAKIIGGSLAQPGEFPYQVNLRYNSELICGGSILSTFFILTAAHCVKYHGPPGSLSIVAGDHDHTLAFEVPGEQIRTVSQVFIHKDYDYETDVNDIALLRISQPLQFNEQVGAVAWPKRPTTFSGYAIVTGWGRMSHSTLSNPSPILQKVRVPLVPWAECRENYRKNWINVNVTEGMICAGEMGKDSCKGDSGGPLICGEKAEERVLCGIVSIGIGCGLRGYPGIYTDVSKYADWIEEAMRNASESESAPLCRAPFHTCLNSSVCLPVELLCDGDDDCPLGDDENHCFAQGQGTPNVITLIAVHPNGSGNASSSSGRQNATRITALTNIRKSCGADEFSCKSGGECILKAFVCDLDDDCTDGSDEPPSVSCEHVRKECSGNQWKCANGNCIYYRYRCDGGVDCLDGSDEAGCGNFPINCGGEGDDDRFLCRNGPCLPSSFRCDSDDDCPEKEDELGCPPTQRENIFALFNLL